MAINPQPPENQVEDRTMIGALWLYILGFVGCSALIFLLPPPYSTVLLALLVLGSMTWGVFGAFRFSRWHDTIASWGARSARLSRPLLVHRNLIAAVFALIGFGLLVAAALDLRPANMQQLVDTGALKMVVGGLALWAAVRFSNRLPELGHSLDVALDPLRRFWWVFAVVGVVLLILVSEINGMIFHILAFQQVPSQIQYVMLMSGVLLVGYGLGGAPPLRVKLRELHIDWWTVIPLAAIIGLALFLRLWNQNGALRYLIDELHFSDGIMGIEDHPYMQILTQMSGEAPYTWVFSFWQSGAVAILGHTWDGLRFVSAICGTLTVLAGFGLADALFDRKTALLAALVLATFPPQVNFSRIAMVIIADPLFGTMALMFSVRALRNNHRIEWAMAGVSLGLTQYFYDGGRLLYPPLVIGFVILLALRGQMRGKWRGIVIMLVTAVIICAPVYYTLIGIGKPLYGRYDVSGLDTSFWQQLFAGGVTIQKLADFVSHLLSGFMIYGVHPEISYYFGGQQALVLDYLLPFFLFGCFYLAWRYPSPAFVIPLWIVATGLGNGLLRDTLDAARYIVVLPALAIALAAGVRYLLPFFEPRFDPNKAKPRAAWVRQTVPVVAIGAIAAAQVGYYFGPHLQYFNVQVRDSKSYRDGIDAAMRVLDLPGNTQPYFVGMPLHDQNVPRDWLGFLSRDGDPTRYFPLQPVTPDTISPKFLLNLPHGVNYAFFVDPNDVDAIAQIQRYFPNVTPPQYTPWDIPASKEYVLFFVDGSSVPIRHPLKPKPERSVGDPSLYSPG